MAVSNIPVPINDVRVVRGGSLQTTYSDSALYNILRTSADIHPKEIQFFSINFNGGVRTGMCFLYEGAKTYGWIMVFHYMTTPRVMTVNEGTTYLQQWAT